MKSQQNGKKLRSPLPPGEGWGEGRITYGESTHQWIGARLRPNPELNRATSCSFITLLTLAFLTLLSACSKPDPAAPTPPGNGTQSPPAKVDPLTYAVPDRQLQDADAAKLEADLLDHKDNIKARVDLLWYYRGKFGDDDARAQALKHLYWLIEHEPRAAVLGTPAAEVAPFPNRGAYDILKAAWQKQAQLHTEDAKVLGHAGVFMARTDPPEAAAFLEKAIGLDEKNPLWREHLAEVYREQAIASAADARPRWAARSLTMYDRALEAATSALKKRYLLERMAPMALLAGDRAAAAKHAAELLKLADAEEPGADRATATHSAHVALGRLRLLQDDLAGARDHLAKAGDALSFPGATGILLSQLDLSLAAAMLEKGEKQAVIRYFQACAKATDAATINGWIKEIEADRKPNLGPYAP